MQEAITGQESEQTEAGGGGRVGRREPSDSGACKSFHTSCSVVGWYGLVFIVWHACAGRTARGRQSRMVWWCKLELANAKGVIVSRNADLGAMRERTRWGMEQQGKTAYAIGCSPAKSPAWVAVLRSGGAHCRVICSGRLGGRVATQ